MSSEANKAHIARYFDQVWAGRRPDLIPEFWAEKFTYHGIPANDAAGIQAGFTAFINAIPDVQITIEDLIAEGDKVVNRWALAGTHQGEFMGVAGSGKPIAWSGITIFRLANGKIAEVWVQQDDLGLRQQLGLIPA